MTPRSLSLTFRRGVVRRAAAWLAVAVSYAAGSALALLAAAGLLAGGFSAAKVFDAMMTLCFAVAVIGNGAALRRWTRGWRKNWLTLDESGVRGCLADCPFQIEWSAIDSIRRSCRYPDAYACTTARGNLEFSVIDLPRPRRIAATIAKRLGLPIG